MLSKQSDAANVSQEGTSNHANENEIDLLELFDVLWNGKIIIAIATVIVTLVAIIYSLLVTETYRAEILLAPAQSRQSSSPLSAQLGGAAALVGINIGQSGSGQQMNSILATLQSREFVLKFIEENNLRSSLLSAELNDSDEATDWQVYRTFSGIFSVTRVRDLGLIQMAIQWPDPALAAEWLNLIVSAINQHEKERDVNEANNAIEYLQDQLAGTQLVEMQRMFYQLIETQTRVIMLADVRDEYVFRIIDPAVVPDQRISPKRKVMVTTGFFSALFLSMIFVFFRYLIIERKAFSRNISGD